MYSFMNGKTHTHIRRPYTDWVSLDFVTDRALKNYLHAREIKL